MGMGFYALAILCEEAGRTVAPIPVVPVLASTAGTLGRFASDEQRERWLPGLANGSALLTAALEEYQNDDPACPGCNAEEDGMGYRISGTKSCVSMAPLSERIMVSARSAEGLIVALVDPLTQGVSLNPQLVTSGETCHELVMNDVPVKAADIVARPVTQRPID